MSLQTLKKYTSGLVGIGAKFSNTLKGLGCDVDWIMTGREANQPVIKLEVTEDSASNNLLMLEVMNRLVRMEHEQKQLKEKVAELEAEKLKQPGQTAVVS